MDIQKRWGFNYEFGIETAKQRAAETAIGVIWRNSPEKICIQPSIPSYPVFFTQRPQ